MDSAKHDERKKLKMQTGMDLLEQERNHDPESIQSCLEAVQRNLSQIVLLRKELLAEIGHR